MIGVAAEPATEAPVRERPGWADLGVPLLVYAGSRVVQSPVSSRATVSG